MGTTRIPLSQWLEKTFLIKQKIHFAPLDHQSNSRQLLWIVPLPQLHMEGPARSHGFSLGIPQPSEPPTTPVLLSLQTLYLYLSQRAA